MLWACYRNSRLRVGARNDGVLRNKKSIKQQPLRATFLSEMQTEKVKQG